MIQEYIVIKSGWHISHWIYIYICDTDKSMNYDFVEHDKIMS